MTLRRSISRLVALRNGLRLKSSPTTLFRTRAAGGWKTQLCEMGRRCWQRESPLDVPT